MNKGLSSCSPFRSIAPLRKGFRDPFFSDLFIDTNLGKLFSEDAHVGRNWAPAVDIKEDEKQFTLTADIPGVDPKDIEITFEKGTLTVRGERENTAEQNDKGYHRVERSYGTFVRSFAFPDSVDVEGVTAKGNNGVLVITVPKKEEAKPKKISVQ